MRHSTLSTTTEIDGPQLHHVAHQAVDAIDTALTAAEHQLASVTQAASETTATTPPA